MTDKPEGKTWRLDHQTDCHGYRVKGRGLVVTVPSRLWKIMPGLAVGDLVSWDGGWHRVTGIERRGGSDFTGLVLAAADIPMPKAFNELPVQVVLDGESAPTSEEIVVAQPPVSGEPGFVQIDNEHVGFSEQIARATDRKIIADLLATAEMPTVSVPGANSVAKPHVQFDDAFDRVQPGKPWWWWFDLEGDREVLKVVRDGSGVLWVHGPYRSIKLEEYTAHPLWPVHGERCDAPPAMFDMTRHRVIQHLGSTDMGHGWNWVESRAAELVEQAQQARRWQDAAESYERQLERERNARVHENSDRIKSLTRALDCAHIAFDEANVPAVDTTDNCRAMTAEDRVKYLADQRDESRALIEDLAAAVERAKKKREQASNCDPGSMIGPDDPCIQSMQPPTTLAERKGPLDILDAKHWDGLPSVWAGNEQVASADAPSANVDSDLTRDEIAELHNALVSVRNAIVFSARDWSLDGQDAWLYAVLVGWKDALLEIVAKHQWDNLDMNQLCNMRKAIERLERVK
jgi:hypothetical protein